jgi:hypothetical protein
MMAQVSDVSEICRLSLKTRESSRIGKHAKSFFILRPVKGRQTRDSTGALMSREAGSGVMGHVTVHEPSLVGRRDPEPCDTW